MFNKKKTITEKASKIEVLTSKELNTIQGGFEYKNIEVVKTPMDPGEEPTELTLKVI